MSKNSIKQAALAVLSKGKTLDEATQNFSTEELRELETLVKAINKKTGDGRYGKPNPDVEMKEVLKTDKQGQWKIEKANHKEFYDYESSTGDSREQQASASRKYQGGDPRHEGKGPTRRGNARTPAVRDSSSKLKMPHTGISEKGAKIRGIIKSETPMKKSWTDGAQWSLEKAIKPGPTLDYKKINPKPNFKDMEAKAPTIDYKGGAVGTKPEWSGAADRAKEIRTKLESESNETAAETIARRQKMNKDEGTNLEPELTSNQKKRMVVKKEELKKETPAPSIGTSGIGAGTVNTSAASAIMSSGGFRKGDKEPHKDDPDHEAKEKKKAKKIKQEAEDLLGMHKKEKDTTGTLIGKQRKKRTVSWAPGV